MGSWRRAPAPSRRSCCSTAVFFSPHGRCPSGRRSPGIAQLQRVSTCFGRQDGVTRLLPRSQSSWRRWPVPVFFLFFCLLLFPPTLNPSYPQPLRIRASLSRFSFLALGPNPVVLKPPGFVPARGGLSSPAGFVRPAATFNRLLDRCVAPAEWSRPKRPAPSCHDRCCSASVWDLAACCRAPDEPNVRIFVVVRDGLPAFAPERWTHSRASKEPFFAPRCRRRQGFRPRLVAVRRAAGPVSLVSLAQICLLGVLASTPTGTPLIGEIVFSFAVLSRLATGPCVRVFCRRTNAATGAPGPAKSGGPSPT